MSEPDDKSDNDMNEYREWLHSGARYKAKHVRCSDEFSVDQRRGHTPLDGSTSLTDDTSMVTCESCKRLMRDAYKNSLPAVSSPKPQ